LAFYPLRKVLFGERSGWRAMWLLLVIVGVLSTFGPAPGSVEGMIYTTVPISFQLIGLPEVLLQSLLLSVILCHWVNHPEKKWLSWVLGVLFALALLFSGLGALMPRPGSV
jgi:4-amino-4-deoxy-L-arabinose transferase-like glycosyltransferase